MNNQDAQLILQARRPGGQDDADPLMTEALEHARHNPELQKWLAEEHALDRCIQTKLRPAVTVPRELKANLLALPKMARPKPRSWRSFWLPAAALVLLPGLAILWLRMGNPAQLNSFRTTMARYSMQRHGHILLETRDMTRIRHWLQDNGMKTEFNLPEGLRSSLPDGCRVVDWNAQKVTLICFLLADGHHVDLFVMDRAAFPGWTGDEAPQFAQAGNLMTVMWRKSDQIFLLTGNGDKKFLQKLLEPS